MCKETEKKLNQKIVTALAAAKEISVGAAAVTTAVSELDGNFTLREEKKGTKAFLDGKGIFVWWPSETKQGSGSPVVGEECRTPLTVVSQVGIISVHLFYSI